MMLRRAGLALCCLATVATACTSRRPRHRPPPPPCHVDGVYQVQAHRAASTGSVCNLNDLASLHGDVTL